MTGGHYGWKAMKGPVRLFASDPATLLANDGEKA
jgi:hypothetical protein